MGNNNESVHPAVSNHLTSFIAAPGQTDVLMVVMGIILLAYCQINSLGAEITLAAQARDEQKADLLTKKINDLEKQLGPEYIVLFDALESADPNSPDLQEILSMFDSLNKSCPH